MYRSWVVECVGRLEGYFPLYSKYICLIVCYLDIKAAYDAADRNIMYKDWIKVKNLTIIVESIRQPFEFNIAGLKVSEKFSRSFHMSSGLEQGSILSPRLYSIFIDKLTIKFKIENSRWAESKSFVICWSFCFGKKNKNDMINLLELAQKSAIENNYRFNTDKHCCKITSRY